MADVNSSPGGLESLVAALGGGGGNPLLTAGLIGGGSLLKGLASLFGGPSAKEKRARKTYDLAQNRLGQDVLHPEQYLADYMRALAPQFNQQAESINKRLGLDSGVAQGALASQQQSTLSNFLFNAKMRNDELRARNDSLLLSLMSQL